MLVKDASQENTIQRDLFLIYFTLYSFVPPHLVFHPVQLTAHV